MHPPPAQGVALQAARPARQCGGIDFGVHDDPGYPRALVEATCWTWCDRRTDRYSGGSSYPDELRAVSAPRDTGTVRQTTTNAHIRAARPNDSARVLSPASAFYLEGGFDTPVSELLDNLAVLLHTDTARVAVAIREHDIVGFAVTTVGFGLEQGSNAELEDLFVEPAHRGTGHATALIEDSCDWARRHGCRTLELVVAPTGSNVGDLFCYYAKRDFADEGRRLLTRKLTLQ